METKQLGRQFVELKHDPMTPVASGADVTRLTPEQQFMVACLRQPFGFTDLMPSDHVLDPGFNWEQTFKLVFQQGLAPLVYSGVTSSQLPIPPSVRAVLKTGALGATVRTEVWLEPTLRKVLDALGSLGLDPIVIKGAALAYQAYPKPFQRTLGDVDLLLLPSQVARASEVLLDLGLWTRAEDPEPEHHLRMHYVGKGQLGVELHHHVLLSPNPYSIDADGFRLRAQRTNIAGISTRALSPVDALHLACVHLAYSHRYHLYPLRSLVDILAITTSLAHQLDWDLFVDTVRSSQTSGAVYWPLWLSHLWLGAPIPASVFATLAPIGAVRRAVAKVVDSPFLLDNRPASGSDVLYQSLVEFSLYTGCSTLEQSRAILRCLFPDPSAVGHLPTELTRSRLSYTAYLARPQRIVHGLVSIGRLIGLVTRSELHHEEGQLS